MEVTTLLTMKTPAVVFVLVTTVVNTEEEGIVELAATA